MAAAFALAAVAGYLLGSLPFGWMVARARGIDIFQFGSRSSGATNVRRAAGPFAGNLVFALDALKGAAAAAWPLAFGFWPGRAGALPFCLTSLVTSLLGHSYSCFTRFRGGKGVATGTGGFLVLMPVPLLLATAIWAMAFYSSGYVSLASILAAVALPAAAYARGYRGLLLAAAVLVSAFVIVRHRANIARLANGTESKFGRRPPEDRR